VAASQQDALRRLDALLGVGLRLARSARSGRVLMARVADAIEPDWLPGRRGQEIADELLGAREEALQPVELGRVERILRDAWEVEPSEELYELESEPVAVTPTSQVHRATLADDGRPVAVKVLRPGLAATVRQDLALLEGLLAPLGAAFPAVDAGALLAEVRERTLEELDLESEAATQRRVHRTLRRHPFLTVPAPVMRLCHDEVLVSEFVEGTPLWRAPDPDEAAARLVVFVIGAARAGVVHADPHPDDVLVLEDGRLAILDFGAVRDPDPERIGHAADALEAVVADDEAALGASLERLGWLPGSHAGTALAFATEVLDELAGVEPVRLDSEAVIAARDRALERPEPLLELLMTGRLAPEDLWPARAVAQLFGSIARVGATGRWRELARAALREGWDASI
jgi:predicted unusual protein kinase regulating ubiquinone biosynthesis (AarF/ABC1/UbiB family)